MKFFSGFCFANEEEIFDTYILEDDFSVAGFSYGAIKAVKYLENIDRRVDTLQLFSPAFFCDKSSKYKNMQLSYFSKDKQKYIDNFVSNLQADIDISKYLVTGTKEQLEELLFYQWDKEVLQKIKDRGTRIEVYIGTKDKIINSDEAYKFFLHIADDLYLIKNRGHLLEARPFRL